MFLLVELNNTNYFFVHLVHQVQDYFHSHEISRKKLNFLYREFIFLFYLLITLIRNPLRGVVVNLSSGIKRPSNGPIIVVFNIRIVGENVIVSSQRRI
jgi:hypothetical protein